MRNRFTLYIAIALLLGLVAGTLLHARIGDAQQLATVVANLGLVTDVFLRLIRMIIAPLVFSTLVSGIAHMGDSRALGRVGVRSIGWFLMASLLSLLLGIVMVSALRPGAGLSLPNLTAAAGVPAGSLTLKEFVNHLVPRSIAEAMANNEILQIVVFAGFFGTAVAALGERARRVLEFTEQLAQVMLKVTGYVMLFAPVAVLAAVSATVGAHGLGILATYGRFIGGFYLSLGLLWLVLVGLGYLVLRRRIFELVRLIREPVLLAFSTASSEAAYPKTMEQLVRFGASERISSFVLPLGYSFNLDGSMMYCTFATLFIAQVYGVELG